MGVSQGPDIPRSARLAVGVCAISLLALLGWLWYYLLMRFGAVGPFLFCAMAIAGIVLTSVLCGIAGVFDERENMKIGPKDIKQVYDEFGLDPHGVPANVQSQVNSMAREIIKLRQKRKTSRKRPAKAASAQPSRESMLAQEAQRQSMMEDCGDLRQGW